MKGKHEVSITIQPSDAPGKMDIKIQHLTWGSAREALCQNQEGICDTSQVGRVLGELMEHSKTWLEWDFERCKTKGYKVPPL